MDAISVRTQIAFLSFFVYGKYIHTHSSVEKEIQEANIYAYVSEQESGLLIVGTNSFI